MGDRTVAPVSSVLGFNAGPIDPTVPVVMSCIVFGLSMDYEVFLLSGIQEEYRRTGDNAQAIANGVERSGRLVTFAAAIMVTVFAAFALGDVTVIKAVGLGTAIAIAVDATATRGLIVPAAMILMGRANWWAPGWLRTTANRLGGRRVAAEPSADTCAAGARWSASTAVAEADELLGPIGDRARPRRSRNACQVGEERLFFGS